MMKRLLILATLVIVPQLAIAQSIDTITNNTKKPPVLDLLNGRASTSRSQRQSPSIRKSSPIEKKTRTKVVTDKAPREKAVLIRALSDYVPSDQFNVSVFKELTYKISEYSEVNFELPGLLKEQVERGDGSVELSSEKTIVRLEIDTAGILGDINFFERLVFNTLDLDLYEDEVAVKIWDFPYSEARKLRNNNQRVLSSNESVVVSESQSTGLAWWIWLIIGLSAVLLITTLIILLRRRNKTFIEEEELTIDNSTFKKMSLSALDKAPVSLKKNEFKKLLVEAPESVASFMENIIESGQDEALVVFSLLAKPFAELISQLKPHMSYSSYLTLLNKIDEDIEDKIDPDTQDKFLLTFNNTVRALTNETNSIEKSPDHLVFGFLNQLNDVQIFKLIEGDRPEMASVLFAQLNDNRKLKVMSLLDDVERSEMLLKLTDISRLPLSVIREIGQRYAKKAKSMAGLHNIDIDGIGAIISTLDELEETKQKEILELMLANDLEKGQIVEQRFIGFFNLSKIEKEILENAMMDIDTEDLLNALYGASEETKEAVLSVRPPREREMIKSELEAGNTISNAAKLKAKKKILEKVRKFV